MTNQPKSNPTQPQVTGSVGYVQCALLYTNSNGERRIRWAVLLTTTPPPAPPHSLSQTHLHT
jgi:hypothetical protein